MFLGSALLVIGGRTNAVGEELGLEVYDTESSEWYRFPSLQRFRHACWLNDGCVFLYGGFNHASPNIPTDEITKIDLPALLKGAPVLHKKALKEASQKSDSPISTEDTPTPSQPSTPEPILSEGGGGGGGLGGGGLGGGGGGLGGGGGGRYQDKSGSKTPELKMPLGHSQTSNPYTLVTGKKKAQPTG